MKMIATLENPHVGELAYDQDGEQCIYRGNGNWTRTRFLPGPTFEEFYTLEERVEKLEAKLRKMK